VEDVEELLRICIEVGGIVLIPDNHRLSRSTQEEMEDYGLTSSSNGGDMWRINFNPKAIARRPYYEAKRAYKKRMRGFLKNNTCLELMGCVSNFPSFHPLDGVAEHKEIRHYGGWGYSTSHFTTRDVLDVKNQMLKIAPGQHFWRDSSNWKYCLDTAATYLHGIEDGIAGEQAAYYEDRLKGYASYRQSFHTDPDSSHRSTYDYKPIHKPGKFKNYQRSEAREKEFKKRLEFCRWIRSELRVAGVKLVKKPVKPVLPSKRKKKKKKRSSKCRKAC
jgi:hypothetical protein